MNTRSSKLPAQTRLWALIVGINKYQRLNRLKGAVSDALDVKSFLTSKLSVPENHIHTLLDEQATRHDILSSFESHLVSNPHIHDGDPIIFYFSGHGTRCDTPEEWKAVDKKCEGLCPWDMSKEDEEAKAVYPIMDKTLWVLLHKLASKKGNNITVVLDCCHSGSGSRAVVDSNGDIPRSESCSLRIPASLDENIWGEFFRQRSNIHVPSGFRYSNMSSHVLLAACHQSERAYETGGLFIPRGKFTVALLSALRHSGLHMTYAELIANLPKFPNQRPQCEGNNKDCMLFSVDGDKRTQAFTVTRTRDGRNLIISAGAMHGVDVGTIFSVYPDKYSNGQSMGYVQAITVDQSSCIVTPLPSGQVLSLSSKTTLFARIVSYTDSTADPVLKVSIDTGSSPALRTLADRLTNSNAMVYDIRRINNPAEADFVIHAEAGANTVTMRRTRNFLAGHTPEHTHKNVLSDPAAILSIFQAAAHTKFHLLRPSSGMLPQLGAIELYSVKTDTSNPQLYVNHQQIPLQGVSTAAQGFTALAAHVGLKREATFGITLRNKSSHDLFPFVFVFDLNTYEVARWYSPPSRSCQAPLKKGSRLTIGHGTVETPALKFTPNHTGVPETTLLKVIASTEYHGMEGIEQEDVFDTLLKTKSAFPKRKSNNQNPPAHAWDSKVLSIAYSRLA